MNNKNIVICCDGNLFEYALFNFYNISIQSKEKLNLHLILDKISKEQSERIEIFTSLLEKKTHVNHAFSVYDFSKYGFEKFKPSSEQSHVNENTYLRLYLDKIIPKNVERILYIDVDTYVVGEISEVFEFCDEKNGNFGRYERIGFDDFVIKNINNVFGINKDSYVNAGVIYLNLDEITKGQLGQKMVESAKKYEEKLLLADQDLLNATLNFKPFPLEFNMGSSDWDERIVDESFKPNLKIIHFFSNVKPWDLDSEIEEYLETKNIFSMSKKDFDAKKTYYIKWRNSYSNFENDMSEIKNKD